MEEAGIPRAKEKRTAHQQAVKTLLLEVVSLVDLGGAGALWLEEDEAGEVVEDMNTIRIEEAQDDMSLSGEEDEEDMNTRQPKGALNTTLDEEAEEGKAEEEGVEVAVVDLSRRRRTKGQTERQKSSFAPRVCSRRDCLYQRETKRITPVVAVTTVFVTFVSNSYLAGCRNVRARFILHRTDVPINSLIRLIL